MSAGLREAARELIEDLEEQIGEIEPASPVGRLKEALTHADRHLVDIEPAIVSDRDLRIGRLIHALQQFKKDGIHFVGCDGGRTGRCTLTCVLAQSALESRTTNIYRSAVDALQAELAILRKLLRSPGQRKVLDHQQRRKISPRSSAFR
jgi:hypothetical protein